MKWTICKSVSVGQAVPMLVFGSIQAAVGGPFLVVGRVGSPWRASGRGQQASSRVWPPSVEASVSV